MKIFSEEASMFVHFHYFAAFAASAVHTSIGRPLKGFFDETRRSDRFKIIQKKIE